MNKIIKYGTLAIAMSFTANLVGCAAMTTEIKKHNLDVQSKMSDTIFLNPVSHQDKTIFVKMRNTSDKDIDISALQDREEKILQSHGYKVVKDPGKANFLLQENILSIGKTNQSNAYGGLSDGFGGAIAGATVGSLTSNGSGNETLAGGLIGAGVGFLANAMVEDVYYNMITDLQLRQRAEKGQNVRQIQTAVAQSGSSSSTRQTIQGTSNWITYRTRIVSVANKVNLEFAEAKPKLEDQLVRETAGIF